MSMILAQRELSDQHTSGSGTVFLRPSSHKNASPEVDAFGTARLLVSQESSLASTLHYWGYRGALQYPNSRCKCLEIGFSLYWDVQ